VELMADLEGHGIFGTWDVGVDQCEFCAGKATAAVAATQPKLRMVLVCREHAEALEATLGTAMNPGGATCQGELDRRSGQAVLCGAVTTHVQLIGFYEGGEPKTGLLPLCRRHVAGEASPTSAPPSTATLAGMTDDEIRAALLVARGFAPFSMVDHVVVSRDRVVGDLREIDEWVRVRGRIHTEPGYQSQQIGGGGQRRRKPPSLWYVVPVSELSL
jgi:hypothetical protein